MSENNLLFISILTVFINLTAFILVGIDKHKSIRGEQRLPEVYLFFISVFFASLGVILGMFFFRHKTRKFYFPLGIGIMLLQQLMLFLFLSGYFK